MTKFGYQDILGQLDVSMTMEASLLDGISMIYWSDPDKLMYLLRLTIHKLTQYADECIRQLEMSYVPAYMKILREVQEMQKIW